MRDVRKAEVIKGRFKGEKVIVEGTDYELWGKDWGEMIGNPAAMNYFSRSIDEAIPDNGVVYGAKRENNESTLFHESELKFLDEEEKKLSTGQPNTLKHWHELCIYVFGEDSAPTRFIADKIKEQGPDEKVIADEAQLLGLLFKMSEEEKQDKAEV